VAEFSSSTSVVD